MTENNIPNPFPSPKAPPSSDENPTNAIQLLPGPEEPIPPEEVQADLSSQPAEEVHTALSTRPAAAPVQQSQQKKSQSAFSVIAAGNYFVDGKFDQDVSEFKACANNKTGFWNLDDKQPLYPGLYALGAISSLGKTTLVHQMADQIAASGVPVLYFSLEQSRFELFSKSLARGFYQTKRKDMLNNNRPSSYPTPSSIDIRRGNTENCETELSQQINAYIQSVQNRLWVIDGAFSITVEDIESLVTKFMEVSGGVRPVVIVDYLQIITPTLVNGRTPDTKTSIDHIVHSLKTMQTKLKLTVIVISSFNRANYMTPVDFESFKESGGIEYTADVMWGLQLSVVSSKAFEHHYDNTSHQRGETSLKEKREMIRKAKAESPRQIDLICLKNRYGIANFTTGFEYYPASDVFFPRIDP